MAAPYRIADPALAGVPSEIDREVARLKLAALGLSIDAPPRSSAPISPPGAKGRSVPRRAIS
ncbi:MAG: hypothetical protein ACXWCY_25600 [Burkholderiales bacterium]